MFPLDMEEFFFALGLNPNVWEKVKSSFRQKAPIATWLPLWKSHDYLPSPTPLI
jgi:hypothetical protein